jgi:hypothetical protein
VRKWLGVKQLSPPFSAIGEEMAALIGTRLPARFKCLGAKNKGRRRGDPRARGDDVMIATLIQRSARVALLRDTPEGRSRLLAAAPRFVAMCERLPGHVRRQWTNLKKLAGKRAWPLDDLKPYFTTVLSFTDLSLGLVEATRKGLHDAKAARDALSALDEVIASLRFSRDEISAVWHMMEKPPARRKRRTTAEIRDALDRGEYLSAEEAMSRVNGGSSEAS